MLPVDWDRDWSKASVEDLALAAGVLANATGGVEQLFLEEITERLWMLHDLLH